MEPTKPKHTNNARMLDYQSFITWVIVQNRLPHDQEVALQGKVHEGLAVGVPRRHGLEHEVREDVLCVVNQLLNAVTDKVCAILRRNCCDVARPRPCAAAWKVVRVPIIPRPHASTIHGRQGENAPGGSDGVLAAALSQRPKALGTPSHTHPNHSHPAEGSRRPHCVSHPYAHH